MTNLINHLKQLDKDATPRPRVIESHPLVGVRVQAEIKGIPPQKISKRLDFGDMRFLIKNAKMILYLRNNLHSIIALLEAGEKLREITHTYYEQWLNPKEDIVKFQQTQFAMFEALNTFDTIKEELE